jgi:hypothetical protein
MGTLLSLTPDQKQFFDENGYLIVEGLYPPDEITTMREQMNTLLRHPESARPGVKFSCEPEEEREAHPLDPDNPHRVWMVFDLPLAGDYWFRQFTDPRVVAIVSDLLGPNINFHNGKARIVTLLNSGEVSQSRACGARFGSVRQMSDSLSSCLRPTPASIYRPSSTK